MTANPQQNFSDDQKLQALEKVISNIPNGQSTKNNQSLSTVRKDILLVDDEPSIRQVIGRFLHQKGYRVFIAATVDNAIQYLTEQEFNLIISDHKMPQKTGEDLYNFVREHRSDLVNKFILMTGSDMEPSARQFIEKTNVQLLTKPFELTKLGETVEQALK
ncbi:MAG: hypothetical protein A3G34_03150 [Candidatus Lindowbacteria bacterium RIFCSPLOWO2_12_FULL_62_27]|nr:MAG: hypothetical protein A3I06_08265 [Candidatus Lindowbacteria bacterium RIFCSPLOWO2_02_FULL_62_12]OGH59294.1 MAG: hypothetical protein A3G34_03150 [Candidatus Lindowbacteria bacterium RIFCSPLOWO2_12_FULL_62_27]